MKAGLAAAGGKEDTRRRLLEIIHTEPGLQKSQIARRSGLAWSTVCYHVARLERLNLVRCTRVGGVLRIAPIGLGGPESDALVAPQTRALLRAMQRGGVHNPRSLQKLTGLGEKSIRRQLQALQEAGIVRSDGAYHPRYWLTAEAPFAEARAAGPAVRHREPSGTGLPIRQEA